MSMQSSHMTRRHFSRAAIGLATSVGTWRNASAAERQKASVPDDCTEALQRLITGNRRFVEGELQHPHLSKDWRKRLVVGQRPFATIVGCSDSRVPPELLFDQGFGDLFVIRVAGNVVNTDVAASVEYAVDHLKTSLVVVMGHDGCGAVTAALATTEDVSREPTEIQTLVSKIVPATRSVNRKIGFLDRLRESVEANVRSSVKQLRAVPDLAKAEADGIAKIIGCVYEIKSGAVRRL